MDHEQIQQATTQIPVAQSQPVEGAAFRPESLQIPVTSSEDSNGIARRDTRPETSSMERHLLSAPSEGYENPLPEFERVPPPPPARSRDGHARRSSNRRGLMSALPTATRNGSGLDWIVPVNEKDHVSAMFIF